MTRLTQPKLFESDMERSAEFSPCRTWRYSLYRCWDWQGYANQVAFVCLNPSTADEKLDDRTVSRCIAFAKRWGFGGFCGFNAYSFRSTDPKVMQAATDPVGPGNDAAIASIRGKVGCVVAAWGNMCDKRRAAEVCSLIGGPIFCLAVTKKGMPQHPLYLKSDCARKLYYGQANEVVQ